MAMVDDREIDTTNERVLPALLDDVVRLITHGTIGPSPIELPWVNFDTIEIDPSRGITKGSCHTGDAPITCQPLFGGSGVKTADTNIDESLEVEDKLLLGHAFSRSWARAEGRRVAGKSAPKGDRTGESQTHSPGISAARQVAIDLAGDVALQDADDLGLGPALLHPALEVGWVSGSWAMRTMTMRHSALLAWRSPPSWA